MFKHEDKRRCSVCKIPYFERNNYYFGKLMTVRDYFAEQCYFNEKRWLINRMVHGWGVVCGLDVKRIPKDPHDYSKGYSDTKVKITEGLAIDCCGREILVCEDQYVDLDTEKVECYQKKLKKEDIQRLVICLEYNECKTESINIKSEACDHKDKYEFNRIRDSFKIRVRCIEDLDNERTHGRLCPLDHRIGVWFDWNEVPGKDELKFKEYLIYKYGVEWIKKANIEKEERLIKICADDNKSLSLEINEEQTKAVLKIDEVWTDEFIVKSAHHELYVYKNQTVHSYLCKELKKGCHECPEHLCLILAEVTIDPCADDEHPRHLKIDICSRRKLVYNNPLLYNLINCYHGDLPHITGINWHHGEDMDWPDFIALIKREDEDGEGLQVIFDRDVEGVNKRTFLLIVKLYNKEDGFFQDYYIPGDVAYENKKGVFKPDKDWYADMIAISEIQEGAGFKVLIRGDHILDKETHKALDGNFIGGKLPSGNGTQGGDFVSWFYVKENPDYASRKPKHSKNVKS